MAGKMKSKRGFTLLEAMMSVALLSIISYGAMQLFQNGSYMWKFSMAKIALNSQARVSMMSISKFVHLAQGSTIKVTRYGPDQPTDSCIKAKLAETAFYTEDDPPACGCTDSTVKNLMFGDAGHEFMFYQINNKLIMAMPYPVSTASSAPAQYLEHLVASDLEQLSFGFEDSQEGMAVIVSARFSKMVWPNKPPIEVALRKTVIVKHFHSAGFYIN